MLRKIISPLAYLCSTHNKPNLVKITCNIKGKSMIFYFPENTKLAPNLERAKVPLDFECGFSCSCGTCAVSLNE